MLSGEGMKPFDVVGVGGTVEGVFLIWVAFQIENPAFPFFEGVLGLDKAGIDRGDGFLVAINVDGSSLERTFEEGLPVKAVGIVDNSHGVQEGREEVHMAGEDIKRP